MYFSQEKQARETKADHMPEPNTYYENRSLFSDYNSYGKKEFLECLAKNNSKIPNQDMTAPAPQEKVLEEYEQSMSVLRPLLDRIHKTDRLIDQIVYQLYGLTEEEIRVVEGDKR